MHFTHSNTRTISLTRTSSANFESRSVVRVGFSWSFGVPFRAGASRLVRESFIGRLEKHLNEWPLPKGYRLILLTSSAFA